MGEGIESCYIDGGSLVSTFKYEEAVEEKALCSCVEVEGCDEQDRADRGTIAPYLSSHPVHAHSSASLIAVAEPKLLASQPAFQSWAKQNRPACCCGKH